MRALNTLTLVLLIVGGLNWGLVGLFGFDLVAALFGEMSLPSRCDVTEADVIVNARVACDPAVLEEHVRRAVEDVCARYNAAAGFRETQSFRPGRPVPTHRFRYSAGFTWAAYTGE